MTRTDPARALHLGETDKVAVIAGSGQLPVNVVDSLSAAGLAPFVVLIDGETDHDTQLTRHEHRWMKFEEAGFLTTILKRSGVTHVVLAGGISRRPRLFALVRNIRLWPILGRAAVALARGDDELLSVLVNYLEANGFTVVGAHEVAPDLLATEGAMTTATPKTSDHRDIEAALAAARTIGALDIGQAAVAIGGRAIALEGIEGTDGLLERVRDLRSNGRIAGARRGVLVKCAKPGQELRADLPTIGPATVEAAHAAGLAGIGVEAGASLVLDHATVVARANALGLFIVGLAKEDR